MKQLVLNLLLFVSFAQIAFGQDQKIKFEHLTIEKGISQIHILSLFKDSKGYLWIGTYNGVFKYDGANYVHYKNNFENSASISNDAVTSIFEDSDHTLWFGTEYGLNRFDRKTEKFEHLFHEANNPNSLSHNSIKFILQDKDGLLWVATYGGGLNSLNLKTKKVKSYLKTTSASKSLSHEKINCLYLDHNNTLWVGGEYCGLAVFDKKSERFTEVDLLPNKPSSQIIVNSIYEDRQGTLWIGTWGDGLVRIENMKAPIQYLHNPQEKNSLSANVIRTIAEDRSGQIWLGTFSGGVDILNKENGKIRNFKNEPDKDETISNNVVWQLYCDNSGIMWAGTFGGGLNKFDPFTAKFPLFQYQANSLTNLNNNLVSCIYQTSDGKVWVGTFGGGINIYDPKTNQFSHPSLPKSNLMANIRSIFEDSKKKVWIGTESGYMRTDLQAQKTDFLSNAAAPKNSLETRSIYTFLEDKAGNLWLGTWGGGLFMIPSSEANKPSLKDIHPISFLEGGNAEHKLSSNIILSLLQDAKGRIWIGTQLGIYQYDNSQNKFIFYQTNPRAKKIEHSFAVPVIFEDKNQNLWIGTFGQGIAKFDPRQPGLSYVSEKEGLASGTISGITQDKRGNLWISTLRGLSKFDPESGKIKNYDKFDGLQDNTFNMNAYSRLTNGMLAFGGPKGLNIFDPAEVTDNPMPPPIVFTDLKLFNISVTKNDETHILTQPIDESEEITLKQNQYSFSLSFTNLSYSQLEKCRYAYKLDGFDKDWIYTDAENPSASYTNLSGGEYTFRVRGCNSDGTWNMDGRSIKINIIPPFWKTVWFLIFISVLMALGTTYLFRLKLQRIVKYKNIQLKRQEAFFEEDKLKKQNEIIQLQKEKLDQELEHKNKELASYVVGIIQKNEKMTSIRNKINELLPLASQDMQKKLNLLMSNIEEEIGSDSNWDKFVISFNLIHDNFLKRFADEFPTITHNDLRICAYIRMNVSNKEIADLLNVSLRTIESTRYRVRRKLNLEGETNLNDFILRY